MRIAVINAWGSNRGDEAMQSSLLCYLSSISNNTSVTVYSNSWLDLGRYKNARVQSWIKPSELYPGVSKEMATMRGSAGILFPQLLSDKSKEILNYDFVLSSPAGPYLGDFNLKAEWKCLWQFALVNKAKVPFGILATSSGPFANKSRNIIRKNLLNKASFWTVRESISPRYISQLGLNTEMYIGSDLVFAHPYREPEAFLKPHQESDFQALLSQLERKPYIPVVLNMTAFFGTDGTRLPFNPDLYIQQMGKLLRHVIESTGAQLLFMPHFYGESLEQRLIKEVIDCIGMESETLVLNPFHNAETQMYLYRNAVFAISHRYHPTIFAAKAECPFLCIRHQFKVDGMLQMFGDPGPVISSTDEVEKWIVGFDDAWQKRREIKSQIGQHLPEVMNASQGHFRTLGKHLKKVEKIAKTSLPSIAYSS